MYPLLLHLVTSGRLIAQRIIRYSSECSVVFVVAFLLLVKVAVPQEVVVQKSKPNCYQVETDIDYVLSASSFRPIHTVNSNAYFRASYFKKAKLNLFFGITTTFAWGVTRTSNPFEGKNIFSDKFYAFGAGPMVHVNEPIFTLNHFSINAVATGGIILYNQSFPPGGDIYNFMFRTGMNFTYRLKDHLTLVAACKWMHVSNGQGPGPSNPYYEGYGLGIGISKFFY